MAINNLVAVKTFYSRMEAEIAKGYLEANGVFSLVRGDDEGGMAPFPLRPTITAIQLLVTEPDIVKAKKLLIQIK